MTTKIAHVIWRDAWSHSNEVSPEALKESVRAGYVVESVGHVAYEDKAGITLAQDQMPTGRWRSIMHIPREYIVKVRRLK